MSSVAAIVILFAILAFFMAKRRGGAAQSAGEAGANQLYVGNLSYRARERHLREHFSPFGAIESLRLMKDRQTGRSRGYAFVTFKSVKSANKARSLHGQEWMGRALVVRPALDKKF